jgi:hypothetical protein
MVQLGEHKTLNCLIKGLKTTNCLFWVYHRTLCTHKANHNGVHPRNLTVIPRTTFLVGVALQGTSTMVHHNQCFCKEFLFVAKVAITHWKTLKKSGNHP